MFIYMVTFPRSDVFRKAVLELKLELLPRRYPSLAKNPGWRLFIHAATCLRYCGDWFLALWEDI